MNDSSTGGYLAPSSAAPPLEDDALDDLFQAIVAAITALPGDMVRPRWPAIVPPPPEATADWCALGVSMQTNDAGPAIRHDPAGEGNDTYIRHQGIELLCSFYGPGAKGYAQRLADGLAVPQNREQLWLLDMAFVATGDILAAPELTGQQWVRRYDLTVSLRRKVTRSYPVRNLRSAQAATTTDAAPPVGGAIQIGP